MCIVGPKSCWGTTSTLPNRIRNIAIDSNSKLGKGQEVEGAGNVYCNNAQRSY
ncbi:hypothetical protein Scep_019638 [Stephania cephalantha]|uniref:Uncharacterized protein n=1 Tax=Stephania cephalantha TaxID=152367 RepID=A0AAP0NN46_9MAGN